MILPAALALSALVSLSACQKADDAAFGARVRAYLMEHPEVIREAVQKLNEKEQLAATKAANDAIGTHRAKLERDGRDFVANPNGKVTLVEFFDYRCGYCKIAAPEVVRLIETDPDIRVVFKELPIFGEVSDSAAKIALTPQVKAKGLPIYSAWMAEKSLDEAAIDRSLIAAGLNPAEVRKAAAAPEIAAQIAETRALARELGIQGTPAFIVGDRMVPGADMEALRAAITDAKAGDLKRPGKPG